MNPGIWEFVKVHSANLSVEQMTPSDYLKNKEALVDDKWGAYDDDSQLEVDFGALDLSTPHLTLPSSIGKGAHLVSRFMSSKLTDNKKPLLDYLLALSHRGDKLMINDILDTVDKLQTALLLAEVYVAGLHPDTNYSEFEQKYMLYYHTWSTTKSMQHEYMIQYIFVMHHAGFRSGDWRKAGVTLLKHAKKH
jgi:sucrose synthase